MLRTGRSLISTPKGRCSYINVPPPPRQHIVAKVGHFPRQRQYSVAKGGWRKIICTTASFAKVDLQKPSQEEGEKRSSISQTRPTNFIGPSTSAKGRAAHKVPKSQPDFHKPINARKKEGSHSFPSLFSTSSLYHIFTFLSIC